MGSGTLNWMKRVHIYAPAVSHLCETALRMPFGISLTLKFSKLKNIYMVETFHDLEGETINSDYLSIRYMMLLKVTYYLESQ